MPDRKKKRRRSGLIELTNAVLTLVVIGLIAVIGLFLFGTSQFYAGGPQSEETAFLVEPGSRFSLVAERLEDRGLISNRFIFQAAGYLTRTQGKVKAGEFLVPANASMAEILELITEGKPIEYFVTVPEGESSWAVAQRISQESHNLTGDLSGMPPEGSVLPGRYDYFPRDTRQSVLDQMTAKMAEELAEVWAECRTDVCGPEGVLQSPQELVTLASIVEKETGVAEERPRVAAVFVNRLKRGMRLQSDPTIIYGITEGEGSLGRGLTRSEIEAETAYNTYQIDGLPPGPIANPGIESLRAVANPAETNDLYFVAAGATPSEGHVFAGSYAEHRRNVARYRQAVDDAAAAARQALEAEEAAGAGEEVTAEETEAPAETAPPQ